MLVVALAGVTMDTLLTQLFPYPSKLKWLQEKWDGKLQEKTSYSEAHISAD